MTKLENVNKVFYICVINQVALHWSRLLPGWVTGRLHFFWLSLSSSSVSLSVHTLAKKWRHFAERKSSPEVKKRDKTKKCKQSFFTSMWLTKLHYTGAAYYLDGWPADFTFWLSLSSSWVSLSVHTLAKKWSHFAERKFKSKSMV